MLGAIAGCELGKGAGSGQVGPVHVIFDATSALRQAAIAGVLEFFHAEGEGDVTGTGGYGIDGAAKRFGAGGAHVFYLGYRDVVESQSDCQGHGAGADVKCVDAGTKPGCLYLLSFYTCIGDAFLECLHHQVRWAGIPAFTKFATTHSEDDYFVFYSAGHFRITFVNLSV